MADAEGLDFKDVAAIVKGALVSYNLIYIIVYMYLLFYKRLYYICWNLNCMYNECTLYSINTENNSFKFSVLYI